VVHGSPAEVETWQRADELLKGRYRHESGQMLGITAAFVDSGGSNTQDVYNFTAALKRRKVFPVKGHSRPNRPILSGKPTAVDLNWRGKTQKRGVELWLVGPDTAKDYLQARWNRKSGPGAVHFPANLPESFYKGLTAEYRTYGYKRGRKVSWWVQKKGEANEPLDLVVYNLGAAHFLQLHKATESRWQQLRDRLFPMQGDLLTAAVDTYPPAVTEPARTQQPDAPPTRQATHQAPASAPTQPSKVVGGKISLGAGSRRGG
jgi:phage terminase large subunit GpA-like protein